MFGQCWAIISLKLTLMRNRWTLSRWLSAVLEAILLLGVVVVSIAASVAMFFVGYSLLTEERPFVTLVALDGIVAGFTVFWLWGLLIELQRADPIDFKKMLFLPVSLRMIFGLNFFSSLFTPALIFFLPCTIGLVAGLGVVLGARVLPALCLAVMFYLAFAVWTYYARGTLAIWFENKRRRRFLLTFLPLVIFVIAYSPSIIFRYIARHKDDSAALAWLSNLDEERLIEFASAVIPIGWFPYGVLALLRGQMLLALSCFIGLTALTGLGCSLAYRATVKHYTHGGSRTIRKKSARPNAKPKPVLTGRAFPLLGEETAALTQATFIGYARHPQIRLMLIMPLFIGALLMMLRPEDTPYSETWIALPLLGLPFFYFMYIIFNVFGMDGNGFRGLILMPVPRHKILFAKNLALFPFVGGTSLFFLLGGAYFFKLSGSVLLVSILQIFFMYLMLCVAGNFLSLYFPYRIQRDTMRAHGNRPTFLISLISAPLLGLLMLVPALCLFLDDAVAMWWGYSGWPVGLTAGFVLVAAAALAYRIALVHAGDLLLAREQRILAVLAKDRE